MSIAERLLRIMALPPAQFAEAVRTQDGFYLARVRGDIGFNAFLGEPNPHSSPNTRAYCASMWRGPFAQRRATVKLAREWNVDLRDFLPRERSIVQ